MTKESELRYTLLHLAESEWGPYRELLLYNMMDLNYYL